MQAIGEVVEFWRTAGPARWFVRDAGFDETFRSRFLALHHRAACRELEHWLDSADGALALQILLDQFPRNCFRGSGHSFATDGLARHYAERTLEQGLDQPLEPALRAFIYLPFEHAEDLQYQDLAVALFERLGDAQYLQYAEVHRDVIRRFGRFPHRNAVLGRISTEEELRFLADGGFAG
ncbi:DUF924 family protein [Stenotrophomonas mori]|uniref:DUF924 family protein n=1 Tax=Stenotrophomonas mori TaxID=2871096 RepID=A0ABT0SIC8_9GAMM|nr:DUF924 family protein [Stenotrophomonas mori]MCL7715082.1 DUF924 family protein [Stenotrophomonas mori]